MVGTDACFNIYVFLKGPRVTPGPLPFVCLRVGAVLALAALGAFVKMV